MSDLPICECSNHYQTGEHHPECPVRREIESLRKRLEALVRKAQIHCAVLEEMGLDSSEMEAAIRESRND